MMRWNPLVAALGLTTAAAAQTLPALLSRLSEEAEVFRQAAPQMIAQETFTQRALVAKLRFNPRIGAAAAKPATPFWQTREIISEYSFGTLNEAPGSLHEFRQVTSVDGHAVHSPETARHSLALGLSSPDDSLKKRMLEEFQKHRLSTAVVDFGQLVLLFTRRQMGNYRFEQAGDERIGADQVRVISYEQTSGPDRMLVFQGHHAVHQPIRGRIYSRLPDGLPLRITISDTRQNGKHTYRDEATVDYTQTAHGYLAPAAITHRGYAGDDLLVEDQFRYTAFRKFGADAEIKFDVLPDTVK
jgi:hypothetical protein